MSNAYFWQTFLMTITYWNELKVGIKLSYTRMIFVVSLLFVAEIGPILAFKFLF